jgi:hypothetical protein
MGVRPDGVRKMKTATMVVVRHLVVLGITLLLVLTMVLIMVGIH